MAELSNIELLEKYFNYELNDAEDTLFKTKLTTDEAFKEEYEIALVLRANELEKRRTIYKQQANIDTSSNNRKIVLRRYIPLMAAAAVLIFIGVNFLVEKKNFDTETYLAALTNSENAKPISVKKSANFNSSLLNEAIEAFNNKDFLNAASKFLEIDKKTKLSDELRYYLGLSLLYEKNYKQAIQQFGKIGSSSGFLSDAEWHIALCQLKLKQYNEAKPILETLLKRNFGSKKDQKFMIRMLSEM